MMNATISAAVESEVAKSEQVQRWPAGRTLFVEGEQPAGIYVIHSGEVELVFSSRHGVKKALRTMGPGDIIGLSEVVAGTPSDCTGTTKTAATIGFIPRTDLQRLLQANPRLWLSIAETLSEHLEACWASMRALAR